MKNLIHFKLSEYKNQGILFLFFVSSIFLIYFLIITKIYLIRNKTSEIESLKKRELLIEQELKHTQNRYERVLQEYTKKQENSKRNSNKSYFSNNVDFEKYISEAASRNFLTLIQIGRIEEFNKKISIPYVIEGEYLNILKFISELEKLSIFFHSSHFSIIFSNTTTFNGKISTYLTDKPSNLIIPSSILPFQIISQEKVKDFTTVELNSIKYIILRYLNGGIDIFAENEIIVRAGKSYQIFSNEKGIFLKLNLNKNSLGD